MLHRGRAPAFAAVAEWWVTEIEQNGLMLAVFDFASYSNVSHDLEPGDRLLLYADGIVELPICPAISLGVPLDYRYRQQRT